MKRLIYSCGNCDTLCDNRSWKNLLIGCDNWGRTVTEIDCPDELLGNALFEMKYQEALEDLRKDFD